MKERIIGHIILLLSILFLPAWIYISLLLLATLILPFFWEGILYALLIMTLYGHGITLSSMYSSLLIGILLILIISPSVRDRLRLHV